MINIATIGNKIKSQDIIESPSEHNFWRINTQIAIYNSLNAMKTYDIDELEKIDVSYLLDNIDILNTLFKVKEDDSIYLNSQDELNELIKIVVKNRVLDSIKLGVDKLRQGLHGIISESLLVNILTPDEFSNIEIYFSSIKL